MSATFKFLVVADESPEFPTALLYAALRARATRAGLVILQVLEPAEPAAWVSVAEEMRRQAQEQAEARMERFAAQVWAETNVNAERIIREGEVKAELRKTLKEDAAIKIVTLAAGGGPGGPGPLVSAVLKGSAFDSDRAVPVVVVPHGVSDAQIRALADPGDPPSADG
ncbi:MAG: universal stress protein [Alphaproteobacteria bacterium]|nr:universal stress protein [Alphaproteobacteria bacterium]